MANPQAPDSDSLDARYRFARRVAEQAAARGMAYYGKRQSLMVEHKSFDISDVVSIADREIEAFIRAELAREFPADGFLGEETGSADLQASCIWVVDPIDGTACFVNGLHNWCVSIGLLVDGVPTLGVIADANHDELFHARRGHGAFVNDQPLRAHPAQQLSEGLVGVGTTQRPGQENFLPFITGLLAGGGMFLRNGSGALMTAYVAAGRLIGYYETHLKSWDCLAGLVMVHEAGGRHNDFLRGNGLLGGNPYLVAAPGVYEQLAELVGPALFADHG